MKHLIKIGKSTIRVSNILDVMLRPYAGSFSVDVTYSDGTADSCCVCDTYGTLAEAQAERNRIVELWGAYLDIDLA